MEKSLTFVAFAGKVFVMEAHTGKSGQFFLYIKGDKIMPSFSFYVFYPWFGCPVELKLFLAFTTSKVVQKSSVDVCLTNFNILFILWHKILLNVSSPPKWLGAFLSKLSSFNRLFHSFSLNLL